MTEKKKLQKKIKISLDKSQNICYNLIKLKLILELCYNCPCFNTKCTKTCVTKKLLGRISDDDQDK